MKLLLLIFGGILASSCATEWETNEISFQESPERYSPNWASLDARPLPAWYDEAKIGIFLHWGLFSVPSFKSAWFWYYWKTFKYDDVKAFMSKNYKPGFSYAEFAPMFTAEFFDPNQWAEIFQKAGARYVVLTSKHHEGYALWPNPYGLSWNSMEVGSGRDLVGELAQAVRNKTNLRFGLYNSLLEWYQYSYENDKANKWTTRDFAVKKCMPTLKELTYWGSEEFLAWLYNDSPVRESIVTNDRWGSGTQGKHGGFYNFADKYDPGVLVPHKWENAMTVDRNAWTYRRNARLQDFLTPEQLISTIVKTVACGGNILVNVGPTKEGTIAVIMEERLLQMGEWLGINGEAIYGSVPWTSQNDTLTKGVWYTSNKDRSKVYAIATSWPGKSIVLASVNPVPNMSIQMLGATGELQFIKAAGGGLKIEVPRPDEIKSKWAWTFVINLGS
ncbi:Alpha-L-fucosidase, partial [Orchesella cincta]